jgi:Xaa-Pro aminopeptidase
MAAGPNAGQAVQTWAAEIADLARGHGSGRRIAFDRLDPAGAQALAQQGFEAVDGLALMDFARAIKSADEIACMQDAIAACEVGLARMQAALRPGITEQALWSVLAQANAELGGEWMETRLLSAGQRTNPWYNECGEHAIAAGELVSFDTDLVGRHGYAVDVSRSWLTGEGPADPVLRDLYQRAHAQVQHNIRELRPGRRFSEVAASSYRLPERFVPRMNRAIAHGIGLCNEYPLIVNPEFAAGAYDGVLEAGMVLCVESYIGAEGGPAGVKLEEQVLVTEQGARCLSSYPFEERLS